MTPQYVHGLAAERELPIIKKIAFGSIRNKLLIILPLALLLSQFLPDALPIILMIGGTYLAFEGAEKVWERISHHDDHVGDLPTPSVEVGPEAEKRMVAGAVRTDLILSAEIMVIALDEVADESFWARLGDPGRRRVRHHHRRLRRGRAHREDGRRRPAAHPATSAFAQRLGHGMVSAMPRLLAVISLVGTVAMLWVGGHILLVNVHEVGWWEAPYELVHDLEHEIQEAATGVLGAILAWLANTAISALIGLVVGAAWSC